MYRLSRWEKMLTMGYRPKIDARALYKKEDLEKPEHEKKPMPGWKGAAK